MIISQDCIFKKLTICASLLAKINIANHLMLSAISYSSISFLGVRSPARIESNRKRQRVEMMTDEQVKARRESQRIGNLSTAQLQHRRESQKVQNLSQTQFVTRCDKKVSREDLYSLVVKVYKCEYPPQGTSGGSRLTRVSLREVGQSSPA